MSRIYKYFLTSPLKRLRAFWLTWILAVTLSVMFLPLWILTWFTGVAAGTSIGLFIALSRQANSDVLDTADAPNFLLGLSWAIAALLGAIGLFIRLVIR